MTKRAKLAGATLVVAAVACLFVLRGLRSEPAPCGPGFVRAGARCTIPPGAPCPSPLVTTVDHGCDVAEHDAVDVPAMTLTVGPSDWEAEGRVPPRTAQVSAFAIDRVEVTIGRACADPTFAGAPFCDPRDAARAASGVTLEKARAYCRRHGGRLPTDDEWLAAAAGDKPRRYPWGDTGAVCRRAAWGLESGPCAEGARGADTVGAHPDGATPLGIHDLAGNVAEWVETPACDDGVRCPRWVRGGSWRTALATELRTWLRREVAAPTGEEEPDPTIGFRCAYARGAH